MAHILARKYGHVSPSSTLFHWTDPWNSYEAVCRYFKSRKSPPSPPSPRHRHTSLIDEAEEDLATLTWPELMTAGGLAGVVAWLVSI